MEPVTPLPTRLTRDTGTALPILCGAMYPSSNPELVAAVSEGGGIGIIQPNSLTHVYGLKLVDGIRLIRSLTDRPIGMNVLLDATTRSQGDRMQRWVEEALSEGIRFFVASLGKSEWVTRKVHSAGGKVYQDITERRWARMAVDAGADGLIAVNRSSGGHVGILSAEALLKEVRGYGLPVVCAGGVGTEKEFVRALEMGYDGVQMGTRFLAASECRSSHSYKEALLKSGEEDIVLTERLTGVPVSVLRTPYIEAMGTRVDPISRFLLRWSRTKKWMRQRYVDLSLKRLGHSPGEANPYEYWQAGRSVKGIEEVLPAAEILRRFAAAAYHLSPPPSTDAV